ncbi:MAG: endo alpha-1,4 polygalactosaminidase [Deltaproteobacteria bacterium]|nr:endo alpha-1,4 polygalactosaminidase [Deltaproteobacteria bacterium]
MTPRGAVAKAFLLALVLGACGSGDRGGDGGDGWDGGDIDTFTPDQAGEPAGDWWRPVPGTSWQWQLTGDPDLSYEVEMYDLDLFDTSAESIAALHGDGRVVICYFSAGSLEDWRPDAADYPEAVVGEPLEGWSSENWLDVRALDVLAPLLEARLDLAVQKGCDGVEPDNVDGWTNETGFPLSGADQLRFNRWLAAAAHARGLSVGLKNDLDQILALVGHFDWALNEECFSYDECELLLPFVDAGKAVFGVEYELDAEDFCPEANALDFDFLVMDLDLDGGREACR